MQTILSAYPYPMTILSLAPNLKQTFDFSVQKKIRMGMWAIMNNTSIPKRLNGIQLLSQDDLYLYRANSQQKLSHDV